VRQAASGSGRSAIAPVLIATAVAGAVALVALRLHFQPPTIPSYAVVGDDGREVVLAPRGNFAIDLRPARPVDGAIGARAFLLRGSEVRPWDPPFSVTREGTIRIAGPVDVLFAGVPAGPWEIAVAVGRPELLPTAPNDILKARADDGRPAGWHLLRQRVRIEG